MIDKPVISIWGIGPSYRLRVKEHIEEALRSGYKDIMDFVILTDDVKYFNTLRKKTDKIKAVIDINKERKKSKCKSVEFIPHTKDDNEYGKEYVNNLREGKYFSYSLNRYSLPTIAKLGYNKVIFLDGDVIIKYDRIGIDFTEEEFWEEFNTPTNSMKGCVKESVFVQRDTNVLKWSMAMGSESSLTGLQTSSIVLNKLFENYNIQDRNPIVTKLDITEGTFRYYNFESTDKLQQYFEVWEEVVYTYLSNRFLRDCNHCGGYMLCDYLIYGVANIFCNLETLNFPNRVYSRRVFYEDRYFLPPPAVGISNTFASSDSLDEFYDKNKELINYIKTERSWPHIEHL